MAHHPLKKWRFENDMTLVELAERLGVTNGYLSLLENRQREPSIRLARQISKITRGKVRIEDFVSDV
jgi:transcriptional regulator with XRE-family HTH domain